MKKCLICLKHQHWNNGLRCSTLFQECIKVLFNGNKQSNDFEKKTNSEWLNANKLISNVNKTKCIWINRNVVDNVSLQENKIGNEVFERVLILQDLGIVIDHRLNFEEQVTNYTKKAASKTNTFYRLAQKLPFDTKKTVYNSFALAQFQYCSTVWTSGVIKKRLS